MKMKNYIHCSLEREGLQQWVSVPVEDGSEIDGMPYYYRNMYKLQNELFRFDKENAIMQMHNTEFSSALLINKNWGSLYTTLKCRLKWRFRTKSGINRFSIPNRPGTALHRT